MRKHKKKVIYVPENDVDVYDYDSDGADEEIGVMSREGSRRSYHYDDSRNSLFTRICQFLILCFFLIILYSSISPNNGIFGIEFKGSFCDSVVKGAQTLKNLNFVSSDAAKPKDKKRKAFDGEFELSKNTDEDTLSKQGDDGFDSENESEGEIDKKSGSDPNEKPIIEPKDKPIADPKEKSASDPKNKPVIDPKNKPVTESKEKPVSKPKSNTATEPKNMPATDKAVNPPK